MSEIDTKYTNGVWYDASVGEVCEISVDESGHVCLTSPNEESAYHSMSLEEWESSKEDFTSIPERAVRDPVSYYNNYIAENLQSREFDAGYEYADHVTETVEK